MIVLFIVGPLRAATDDLDLVCHYSLGSVVHFEGDFLDKERPDFITEPVGVKRTLLHTVSC